MNSENPFGNPARHSEAFRRRMDSHPQDQSIRLERLEWEETGSLDGAVVQCYSSDHMDFVRSELLNQHITVVGENKQDLTVTVNKNDLLRVFPDIFSERQL